MADRSPTPTPRFSARAPSSSIVAVLDHREQLGAESLQRIESLINLEFSIQRDVENFKEAVTDQQGLQDMSDNIKKTLDNYHNMIGETSLYAEEQDSELEKEAILKNIKKRQKELTNLTVAFRKAKLSTKENLRRHWANEREALLENKGEETLRRRRVENQKSAVKMSQNITAGLQRARNMLSEELERTNNTMGTLDNSSAVLIGTVKEWNTFSGAVGAAKNVLNRMSRRDRTDKLLISLGFIFFLLVVLFIIRRRVGGLGVLLGFRTGS